MGKCERTNNLGPHHKRIERAAAAMITSLYNARPKGSYFRRFCLRCGGWRTRNERREIKKKGIYLHTLIGPGTRARGDPAALSQKFGENRD